MNAIMNEKGRQTKLLAAIVAIAMIVCAAVVIASPAMAEGADSTVPAAPTFNGADTATVGSVAELEALTYYNSNTDVFIVPSQGLVLTLTNNITVTEMQIIMNGDLMITGGYTLQFGHAVDTAGESVIDGTSNPDVDLVVSGTGTKLTVSISNASNFTPTAYSANHILENVEALRIIGGANVTLNQPSSVMGVTWMSDDEKNYLVMDNSTMNLDAAGFAFTTIILTGSTISVDNNQLSTINLYNGSKLIDSEINVTNPQGADLNTNETYGTQISFIGTTDMSGSSVSVGDKAINMNGATINMDASSELNAGAIRNSSSATSASTINGGTVNAEFQGLRNGNNATQNIVLNGTTVTEGALNTARIQLGEGGIVVDAGAGNTAEFPVNVLTANSSDYPVIVKSGTANFNVDMGNNVYIESGASATGASGTISSVKTVTATTSDAIAAAAAAGVPIEITTSGVDVPLDQDIVLSEGAYFVKNTNSKAIVLNGHTITNTNGGFNYLKIKSTTNGVNNFAHIQLNGDFTISEGSVFVDAEIVDGAKIDENNVITLRQGNVTVSGNLSSTLTFDTSNLLSNVTVTFEDFTVNAGAVIDFVDSDTSRYTVTYQTKGDFVLYGALISDDDITLKVGFPNETVAGENVENHSDFVAYAGAVIQQNIKLVSGNDDSTITLDDSLKTMEISVDVTGHQYYSQMQTVVIVTSLEITSYATLEIAGQLVINEGVTLTIEENGILLVNSATAQMIVNGQITVLGGGQIVVSDADSVDVAGSIVSDGQIVINSDVTIEENGSVTVDNGEDSSIFVSEGLTINAGGELTVRGEMTVSDITNKGTVTLNGAVLVTTQYDTDNDEIDETFNTTKISLAADGATVNITSFYSETTDNTLTVTDEGLYLYDATEDADDIIVGAFNEASTKRDYRGTNTVTLEPTDAMTGVRNLVISETVTSTVKNRVTYYDYGMNISGTPAVVDERVAGNGQTLNPENASYNIVVAGVDMRVAAETELTLGARVTLTVNDVLTPVAKDGVLNVAGTVYAINTYATITNNGIINVTGMIESTDTIGGNVNAAHYEATVDGNTRNYYTTLNTAVANGATDIDVLGEITILENLTIPNGVTVRGTSTSVMSIGNENNRDVVVTVESGATVRNFNNSTGGIIVDGTLEFADSNSSKSNRIVSDVSVANSPAVSYTNIYTALQNAESGETVTITRDAQFGPVELTDDIAVGEGVTLVIPNARSVQVNDGVQLTVDGIVQVIGTIVSESGYDGFNPLNSDDTEKDADEYGVIIVNGTMMSLSKLPYAAVPGTGTTGEYGYYIAGAYYQIVNSSGSYYYITPVEQAGVVSNDVREGAIEIYGENTAGDVTFTGDSTTPVTVTVTAGASLEASSITLSYAEMNINVDGAFTGTVSSAAGSVELQNVADMSVSSHFDDETEVLSIEGVPGAADTEADVSVAIASGAVTIDGHINDGDFNAGLLDDFTIASGATLTVTGSGVVLSTDEMTVDGTLVATDNGSINATTMIVRGTLTVEPRTDDHAAGAAQITTLYVGITYNEDNILELIDASAATVTADAIRNLDTVIVSADSTVTGDLVTDMDSTEFYVEDALWITVYGAGDIVTGTAANPVYHYQPGDLTESEFTAWTDADGTNVPAGTAIGATGCEQVYANINYDVYIVIIMTDNSIGSVAIDGQMLVNTGIGFVLPGDYDIGTGIGAGRLDAGEHTITYTLAGGYEGTATLTSNGVNATVSGMTFTLSGDFEDANNVPNVNYLTLGGATYSGNTVVIDGGNGGSSDMGLTDYLLIILVVLIVIMAIIVALRLMRS